MVNKATVVFRVDASLQMGSGHVMRCLTLAKALRAGGAECLFICREHPGHLTDFIRSEGFGAYGLGYACAEVGADTHAERAGGLAHAAWLGVSQNQDAEACAVILEDLRPDWLIVDHYALDVEWERSLRVFFTRLLVIDDLADREHICDLLLDQNLGRVKEDYTSLVPGGCQLLVGPQYALLRSEFARLREKSLERRRHPLVQHILITMGGVDHSNATKATLEALKCCALPANSRITVIMGLKAPYLAEVLDTASHMPWPTEVLVNITDMAEQMVSADVVIGAAGSTSWERCCLGVPTIMVVLADNQRSGAKALSNSGSVLLIERVSDIHECLPLAMRVVEDEKILAELSHSARDVCDGLGVQRLIKEMGGLNA